MIKYRRRRDEMSIQLHVFNLYNICGGIESALKQAKKSVVFGVHFKDCLGGSSFSDWG